MSGLEPVLKVGGAAGRKPTVKKQRKKKRKQQQSCRDWRRSDDPTISFSWSEKHLQAIFGCGKHKKNIHRPFVTVTPAGIL